jgi:hypothetical protein
MAKTIEDLNKLSTLGRDSYYSSILRRYEKLCADKNSRGLPVDQKMRIPRHTNLFRKRVVDNEQIGIALESVFNGSTIEELKSKNIVVELNRILDGTFGIELSDSDSFDVNWETLSDRDGYPSDLQRLDISIWRFETDEERSLRFIEVEKIIEVFEQETVRKKDNVQEKRRALYEKLKKEFEGK